MVRLVLQIDFVPTVNALDIKFEQTTGGGKPLTTFSATPTMERQIITPPVGYVFASGVVEAIPNNYGLITYNGYELMVS